MSESHLETTYLFVFEPMLLIQQVESFYVTLLAFVSKKLPAPVPVLAVFETHEAPAGRGSQLHDWRGRLGQIDKRNSALL